MKRSLLFVNRTHSLPSRADSVPGRARRFVEEDIDQPIAIDLLKRFVAEREDTPAFNITPGPEKGAKVAIVGSGPTGLMAAYDLRRHGYPVTVFEALPLPGGTMAVGTGRFRLPEEVLNREMTSSENLERISNSIQRLVQDLSQQPQSSRVQGHLSGHRSSQSQKVESSRT